MNEELQLKLQAYLDGELSVAEANAVRDLLSKDTATRDLLEELTHTRDTIARHETEIKLAESREFYWSGIQRQITSAPRPSVREGFSFAAWLRRVLVPAGAAAAVAIAALLSLPRGGGGGDQTITSGDMPTFTYHNYSTGATLVWLDYAAAENDFSDAEWDDTLDL